MAVIMTIRMMASETQFISHPIPAGLTPNSPLPPSPDTSGCLQNPLLASLSGKTSGESGLGLPSQEVRGCGLVERGWKR